MEEDGYVRGGLTSGKKFGDIGYVHTTEIGFEDLQAMAVRYAPFVQCISLSTTERDGSHEKLRRAVPVFSIRQHYSGGSFLVIYGNVIVRNLSSTFSLDFSGHVMHH